MAAAVVTSVGRSKPGSRRPTARAVRPAGAVASVGTTGTTVSSAARHRSSTSRDADNPGRTSYAVSLARPGPTVLALPPTRLVSPSLVIRGWANPLDGTVKAVRTGLARVNGRVNGCFTTVAAMASPSVALERSACSTASPRSVGASTYVRSGVPSAVMGRHGLRAVPPTAVVTRPVAFVICPATGVFIVRS